MRRGLVELMAVRRPVDHGVPHNLHMLQHIRDEWGTLGEDLPEVDPGDNIFD